MLTRGSKLLIRIFKNINNRIIFAIGNPNRE